MADRPEIIDFRPFLLGLGIKTNLRVVALQAGGTYVRAILPPKSLVKGPSNIPGRSCSRMGYIPSVTGAL